MTKLQAWLVKVCPVVPMSALKWMGLNPELGSNGTSVEPKVLDVEMIKMSQTRLRKSIPSFFLIADPTATRRAPRRKVSRLVLVDAREQTRPSLQWQLSY